MTHAQVDNARPGHDVDLFVIGAGSGGTRAARIAAQYGAKVMIAEEFRVGGTCVMRGCVPKKLMVYASRFTDAFDDARGFGWSVPEPTFDWRTLVDRKEAEITRLSKIYVANLEKAGVTILDARASVADPHHVRLGDGSVISTGTILIATGGVPHAPEDLPGFEHAISSNEIFDLPLFPKRLAIVGTGYIGIEFASIFTRLGAEVTVIARGDNILRGFDDDMRDGVREGLTHAGVAFKMNTNVTRIDKGRDGLVVGLDDGTDLACDQILMAVGRTPNTRGLGLAEAGVALGRKGEVKVDAWSRSNIPSIYAVGDVTDRVALTPIAIREGQAFADTVFGGRVVAVDHTKIATAVFSTPEVGTVGLTEAEAVDAYPCVDVYAASFRPLKATLSGRGEKTVMKIIVDGRSDVVLGVHVLGEDAGEMAQVLGIVVRMGATKADFDDTVALHPTSAEELVTMRTRRARHERSIEEPAGPGLADVEPS